MQINRSLYVFLCAFICTGLGFAAGFFARDRLAGATSHWQVLAQAYDILRQHGLKEPPADPALEYGMIRGMLQAYDDPFTSFVEPVQHELESNTLQGSFGGIGVSLGRDADNYPILFPFPDSPAAQAGVLEGDRLVQVETLGITPESTTEQIQAALRGPVGEAVQVGIQRPPAYEALSFSIRRAEIALPSVTWHLEPSERRLGVIEVNVIAASTPDEIRRAVDDLSSRRASAFVLDLRDNFGGLLTAGVDAARLFLRAGVVIEQQYKGKAVETFQVEQSGPLADLPLVVLVNQHTASAAEIIAGALQAQERAKLVGSATYGKDSIQLVFDLDDGSSLHVTSAKWWVPGLEQPLGGSGLTPDVEVAAASEPNAPDPAIEAAVRLFFNP